MQDSNQQPGTVNGDQALRTLAGEIMKPLRTERTVLYVVNWDALEEFICEAFGVDSYDFCADQETGTDTEHEFGVSGDLSDHEEKAVKNFIASGGDGTFITGDLLNYLASKGLIETGTYLVKVRY